MNLFCSVRKCGSNRSQIAQRKYERDSSCTHVIYLRVVFNSMQYGRFYANIQMQSMVKDWMWENVGSFEFYSSIFVNTTPAPMEHVANMFLKGCIHTLGVSFEIVFHYQEVRMLWKTKKKTSSTTKSMRLWIQIVCHYIIQYTFAIHIMHHTIWIDISLLTFNKIILFFHTVHVASSFRIHHDCFI